MNLLNSLFLYFLFGPVFAGIKGKTSVPYLSEMVNWFAD